MAEIKHAGVTVTLPDELAPPEEAGKLSPEDILRLPKPPHGIGLACSQAADAMEAAGDRFTAPGGMTPEVLRLAGRRAEGMDAVLRALDVVRAKVQQANLLFDAEAWEMMRKLNDQAKAQAKYEPELSGLMAPVTEFFKRGS